MAAVTTHDQADASHGVAAGHADAHVTNTGLSMSTNLFGSSFFVMTGFHGVHVTLGILMLLSLYAISMRGGITQEKSEVVELAGLYWHFVDIVWIVIFTVIYLIP